MAYSNLITSHFQKRETALKWLFASAAYSMLFGFMESPSEKTISLIAKENLWLFFIFTFLYAVSMITNLKYMYNRMGLATIPYGKTKTNRKGEAVPYKVWAKRVLKIALFMNYGFGFTLTTLMPKRTFGAELSGFATAVHWAFGFGNILLNATFVLLFCLNIARLTESKKLKTVFAIGTAICIVDLLVFLGLAVAMGPQQAKNGIFELIPLAIVFVVTYFVNHTDIAIPRAQRDAEETRLIHTDNKDIYNAVSYGALMFAWLVFTFYAFVRNPIHYTISMTGIEYRGGFTLVSLSLTVAFILNFIQMFKKSGYKNVFVKAIAFIGSVSIVSCVITPTTMGTNIDIMHVVGTLAFFYLLLAAFIFYTFSRSKENEAYKPFFIASVVITAAVTLTMIVLFLILKQKAGRTGLTELIPLEFMLLFTYLENYTSYFEKAKVNKEKAMAKA